MAVKLITQDELELTRLGLVIASLQLSVDVAIAKMNNQHDHANALEKYSIELEALAGRIASGETIGSSPNDMNMLGSPEPCQKFSSGSAAMPYCNTCGFTQSKHLQPKPKGPCNVFYSRNVGNETCSLCGYPKSEHNK